MIHSFIKTCIGYSHIKTGKVCQDFTSLYKDPNKTIITCCDGHGGDIYIRSNVGSHLASNAIINVFNSLTYSYITRTDSLELEKQVKLLILCEWNKLIERDYSKRSFKKKELINLNDEQRETLKLNPAKAYGTTLTGAMIYGHKILVVGIGDTEVMGLKDGNIIRLFEDDSDPVGNITYSMCQEDAFNYLRVKVLELKDYNGILLCTDGLSSPYQSYDNFNNSFVKPVVKKIAVEHDIKYIDDFIEQIALKLGVGDDVSLALLLNDKNINKYLKD